MLESEGKWNCVGMYERRQGVCKGVCCCLVHCADWFLYLYLLFFFFIFLVLYLLILFENVMKKSVNVRIIVYLVMIYCK